MFRWAALELNCRANWCDLARHSTIIKRCSVAMYWNMPWSVLRNVSNADSTIDLFPLAILPTSTSLWLAGMLLAEASKSASSFRVVAGKKTMLSIVWISSNWTRHCTRRPLKSRCVSRSWAVSTSCGLHVIRAWGNVKWKMSSTQLQIRRHDSSPSFGPLLITRFSKQLTPDRANGSFSCETHHKSWAIKSSTKSGPIRSKYCVMTSTMAYNAWLHVVVSQSDDFSSSDSWSGPEINLTDWCGKIRNMIFWKTTQK